MSQCKFCFTENCHNFCDFCGGQTGKTTLCHSCSFLLVQKKTGSRVTACPTCAKKKSGNGFWTMDHR